MYETKVGDLNIFHTVSVVGDGVAQNVNYLTNRNLCVPCFTQRSAIHHFGRSRVGRSMGRHKVIDAMHWKFGSES
jgi:hypothetical protein